MEIIKTNPDTGESESEKFMGGRDFIRQEVKNNMREWGYPIPKDDGDGLREDFSYLRKIRLRRDGAGKQFNSFLLKSFFELVKYAAVAFVTYLFVRKS